MLPFCGHFYCVSHQQSNSNKLKDFKSFKYYGIQIETFELTTVEYRKMKKLDIFELCEFELKEFSCKCLLVNSERIKKFVRFRWFFELQEFELYEFNCRLKTMSKCLKVYLIYRFVLFCNEDLGAILCQMLWIYQDISNVWNLL